MDYTCSEEDQSVCKAQTFLSGITPKHNHES